MQESSTMINSESTFDSKDDVERLPPRSSFHKDLIEPKKPSSNNVQVIQYVFNFKTSQFEKFSGIQRSSEKLRFSKESRLALDPVIPLIRIDLNRKESRLALLDPVNASIPIQRWEPVVITRPIIRNENQLRNKKEEVSKGSPKRPTPVIPLIPIDLNKSDFEVDSRLREPSIATTSRSQVERHSEIHANKKQNEISKGSPKRLTPVIPLIPIDLNESDFADSEDLREPSITTTSRSHVERHSEIHVNRKQREFSKGSPDRLTPLIPLIPIDLNESDFADSQDLREPIISTTSRSHLEKYREIHVNEKNKGISKVSPRRQVPVIRLIPVDLIKSESSYPPRWDPTTTTGETSGGLWKRRRSCEIGENLEDGRANNKKLKVASNNLCTAPSVSTSRILIDSPKRVKGKCRPNPSVLLTRLEEMFPATVFQPKNRGEELGQGQSKSSPVRILGFEHPADIGKNGNLGENKLMEWILLGNNGQAMEKEKQADLIICDFCLNYTKKVYIVERHRKKCTMQGLKPSDVIVYRKGDVSIFRVDGLANQSYCYNLMRLSKLYVDCVSGLVHATRFHFYVLYVNDHFAGYFSKEKGNDFTLGAILVLPKHQRQGYGKLLIAFSYELSKHDGRIGTPERPFTPSGRKCFFAYWCETMLGFFSEDKFMEFHVEELSRKTHIHPWDILPALRTLGDLYRINTTFVFRLSPTNYSRTSSNPSSRNPLDVSCVTWPVEESLL